jgi:hypothetical protein
VAKRDLVERILDDVAQEDLTQRFSGVFDVGRLAEGQRVILEGQLSMDRCDLVHIHRNLVAWRPNMIMLGQQDCNYSRSRDGREEGDDS